MQFLFIFAGILAMLSYTKIITDPVEPYTWISNGIRAIAGLLWGLFATQICLAICTVPVWFMWWGIPIVICSAIDAFYHFDNCNSVLGTVNTVLSIGVTVFYLVMITIYPASITKATYEFADAYVTIVDSEVPATEVSNIGLVSEKTAHRIANPKIAEFGNSSKYTLGTYTKQYLNGEMVWVTPVEYAGFWRAKGSTPGYIIVDSFDTLKDVKSVEDNKFYYMPSAKWSKDLLRHVHNELPTKELFDYMFQVTDDGLAYWIVPYGHYEHFVYLPVVEGVAIVNPTTGAIDIYEKDEVPEWVDAIIPGDIAEKYGNYYGKNKHGFWAKIAPTDQFQLTTWAGDDAWSIVYDENGTMWYATDTTTLNSDKSMVGYMMINARTGDIKYFPNVSGLNGMGISQNFTQLYKEKTGWSPVEPTLYNIYNTLTWFSTMVDENGAIQAYCLGDTKGNVVGEITMEAALSAYKRMLTTSSIDKPTENKDLKSVEGTVKRVITLENSCKILLDTNQIFVVEKTVSAMAQFTSEGDYVKISYLDTQEDEFYVITFTNVTLE